jgi:HAD superfamily hydrolase (TIGR01549 family)
MKDIKVVIFDCDGVMFDTAKANTAYYNSVLHHFNMPDMTPEQFAFSHMHTADEAFAYLFKDEKIFKAAQTYRKNMSYLPFLKYMEIEPYLKTLLTKLRPEYKTAVATNRTDTMKRVLVEHNLKDFFDMVVSALDVKYPKPHPEQLFKILKNFQLEPDNAVYVGDSELDEIASKAAKITFIAYKNKSISADFHITTLKEVEEILEI